MSVRELVVLGTASQVPTRTRAHHAALLRWDDQVILFDPGEGTQRQLSLAGVSAASITAICITHLHGDHCLGLPGVLQRLSLDRVERPVDVYFPASGQEHVDRLRHASIGREQVEVREHPVDTDGLVYDGPRFTLEARALDHRVDTYGWRLVERDGRRMLRAELDARGVTGPDVGRLQREGSLETARGVVRLEEVSEQRRGQVFAFVMDTRLCDAAVDLARNADLLVCESTFLSSEADLADEYAHLTAADAARIARRAHVRRLVLTHFSQRHPDVDDFAAEAREHFPDVHAARDLDRVPVPPRRSVEPQ